MLRAGAKFAAWLDLAAFADVSSQAAQILVVDVDDIVDTKLAHLAAWRESSTAATWTSTARAATAATGTTTFLATFASITLGAAEAGSLRALTAVCVGSIFRSFL